MDDLEKRAAELERQQNVRWRHCKDANAFWTVNETIERDRIEDLRKLSLTYEPAEDHQ